MSLLLMLQALGQLSAAEHAEVQPRGRLISQVQARSLRGPDAKPAFLAFESSTVDHMPVCMSARQPCEDRYHAIMP